MTNQVSPHELPDRLLVVGGGLTPSGELTLSSQSRVETAAEQHLHSPSERIVFSAGTSWTYRHEARTEAELMAEMAVEVLGVPESDIVLETQSTNTIGNIALSRPLLEGAGLVGVVSQAYHLRRCLFICRRILDAPAVGVRAPDRERHILGRELISSVTTHAVLWGVEHGDVDAALSRNAVFTEKMSGLFRTSTAG